jgi:hypothetical protein
MNCGRSISSYHRQLNKCRFAQVFGIYYVAFNVPKTFDAVRFRDHYLEVFGVVPDPLGQGENKFVIYERLCEELWFKVLKLCCRWHLSTMLEVLCSCGDRYIASFCTDSFLRT